MASLQKRRCKDGGVSWDVTVRVCGFPTRRKSFRTRHEADAWGARIEAAAQGHTLVVGAQATVNMLMDEAEPRLRSPQKLRW